MAVSTLNQFHPHTSAIDTCIHCRTLMESSARFCGECGAPSEKARSSSKEADSFARSFAAHKIPGPMVQSHAPHVNSRAPITTPLPSTTATPLRAEMRAAQQSGPPTTPDFAAATAPQAKETAPTFATVTDEIPQALRDELGQYIVLLARERFFLYMHCCIFLAMNLFGFWLSMTAYNGYVGDELTKFVMALTPLMFINSIALACLAPIKGTKKEIARLKEKIAYVRFQIDYRTFFK